MGSSGCLGHFQEGQGGHFQVLGAHFQEGQAGHFQVLGAQEGHPGVLPQWTFLLWNLLMASVL